MERMKRLIKTWVYSFSAPLFALVVFLVLNNHRNSRTVNYSPRALKVFRNHFMRRGRIPNCSSPSTYNDKIAWLMIYDHDPMKIPCSDKLAVKDYISEKVGSDMIIRTLKVYDKVNEIGPATTHVPSVIKANHDSGSVVLVRDNDIIDWDALRKRMQDRLRVQYGKLEGEWPYQYITPKVFAEEFVGSNGNVPADFKFHCTQGTIAFIQYIYDRKSSPKEVIMDENGVDLGVQLDEYFEYGVRQSLDPNWKQMCEIARKLSHDFCYVRVDMYSVGTHVYVGELTFYPRAGCYPGKGQEVLGRRIDIRDCCPKTTCDLSLRSD